MHIPHRERCNWLRERIETPEKVHCLNCSKIWRLVNSCYSTISDAQIDMSDFERCGISLRARSASHLNSAAHRSTQS